MLDIRGLFWPGRNPRPALFERLSFTLASGEALAVTGPAGAGKSILLRILSGSLRDYAGQVLFQGKELGDWSREFFEATGAVLQPSGLAPQLTALENLEYHSRLYRKGHRAAAREALDRVGLAASAGVRAASLDLETLFLVSLARALVHRPVLLCIDTPSAELSQAARERASEIVRARQGEGLATVLATRDEAWAAGMCGRLLRLDAGTPGP
jgi:fluoroquinolone transport system ATP-binding protein